MSIITRPPETLPNVLPELPPEDPLIEVLERAAEIIQERGWCQGDAETPDGRVCLGRALTIARAELDDRRPVLLAWEADVSNYNLFDWLIRLAGPKPGFSGWNDAPGRTKGEVLAAIYDEIARRRPAY